MKHLSLFTVMLCIASQLCLAQPGGFMGFGGSQASSTKARFSQKFENLKTMCDFMDAQRKKNKKKK